MLNDYYAKKIEKQSINIAFEGLNDKQKEIIKIENDCVIVIASPGSGKTFTLISKILYLLQNGLDAKNILAITFTRKACEGYF